MVVDENQLLTCLDPLAKKKDANNRNGVVGNTGRNTPRKPSPKNVNPNKI